MIARHLGGDDVAVRVHRDEQAAPLEREARRRGATASRPSPCAGAAARARARAAPRCRPRRLRARRPRARAARSARACRSPRRASRGSPSTSHAASSESAMGGVAGPPEVVRGDRAHRLERRLREERAHAARVFALPRAKLDEVRGRQDELDAALSLAAREHEPAREERLERRRNRRHEERARAPRRRDAGARRSPAAAATGSRSSGSATSARATCDGGSRRLAGSMRMPSRDDERVELRLRAARAGCRRVGTRGGGVRACGTVRSKASDASALCARKAASACAVVARAPPRRHMRGASVPAGARRSERSRSGWPRDRSRARRVAGPDVGEPGDGVDVRRATRLPRARRARDSRERRSRRPARRPARPRRRARRRARARRAKGSRARSTSSTSTRRSRRRPTTSHEARLDGPADGRVVRTLAYDDTLDAASARTSTCSRRGSRRSRAPRRRAGRSGCTSTGARRTSCASLLDEILGRDAFVNEIVWRRAPNLGRQAASQQFGRTLDTIVVYGGDRDARRCSSRRRASSRSSRGAIRWDDDEGAPVHDRAARRLHRRVDRAPRRGGARAPHARAGKVYIKYFLVKDAAGVWCRERRVDALWTDVPPLRHAARRRAHGFPDAEAARAARPHHRVRDAAGRARRRSLRRERDDGRERRTRSGGASIARRRGRRWRSRRRARACCAPARRSSVERVRAPDARRRGATRDACASSASDARGASRVALVAPREPLAWAIDAAYAPARPFHAAWHSERVAGRAAARLRRARRRVESRDGRRVAVRVCARRRRASAHAASRRRPPHDPARPGPRPRRVRGGGGARRRARSSTRRRCSACGASASSA